MLTLCTLFDHNYLDKGLAMYESLEKVCDEFELYVLAMSDKCYEILTDLSYSHIKPIKLIDFEDEELLRVKPIRKVGEYCWTCSSSLIRYVLMTYQPDCCTYIDADMLFYSNPQVLIDEMKQKNASVLVVGHRFNKSEQKRRERLVGKFCVEFNTFRNDVNGLKLLNIWRNQCLEHCSEDGDGVYWGDQKYLDNWCNDYSFCVETQHLGAGIGPWNIAQYRYVNCSTEDKLVVKCGGKKYPVVFYHFENIQYLERRKVRMNVFSRMDIEKKLVYTLYPHYLRLVDKQKSLIKEKFGLEILLKSHPGLQIKEIKKKSFWKRLCNITSFQKFKLYVHEKLFSNTLRKRDLLNF